MPFLRYCELMLPVSIVALSLLSGCAGTIPATPKDQRAPTDPWEPINRRLMNFNQGVDKVTFKPLAKGYQKVAPNIMRQGVGNFSSNLRGPLIVINNILQDKFRRGVSETGRFLVNSTLGLGGLIDVGTDIGLESHPENFGETFAV